MKKVIHIGSQSLDVVSNTQNEITAIITALVASIPNLTHIAIGTYMDYGSGAANDQFTKWASAIHAVGKKMWIRSAGYNDWQGFNGATQYTSADFRDRHRTRMITWLGANKAIFQPGDIFEPIPDEPENNSVWNSIYGTIGSGAGKTAFNSFITDCINSANAAFINNNITGVVCEYAFTNPSANRDIITQSTADVLITDGIDEFPENGVTTVSDMLAAMIADLNTWVLAGHTSPPKLKHITFGPNAYSQLTEANQSIILKYDFDKMVSMLPLEGITIWQFGATDNASKSRLFDWSGSAWVPRSSAKMVDSLFSQHFAPIGYGRAVNVGNGMSRNERAS